VDSLGAFLQYKIFETPKDTMWIRSLSFEPSFAAVFKALNQFGIYVILDLYKCN
jgi:hypothetical protein